MDAETTDIQNEQHTAGLDTTTGHGADSFFTDGGPVDPWRDECLITLVDLLINHAQVKFPLWSRAAGQAPTSSLLPWSFSLARERGLLDVHTNTFADEVRVPPGEISDQFDAFSRWAEAHSKDLNDWAKYHLETPRLIGIRRDPGPWDEADQILPPQRGRRLSETAHIPEIYLRFGFQTFIRAIQYSNILGTSIPYFPHPVRERALNVPMPDRWEPQWSWGRYFVEAVHGEKLPRRLEDLLDSVSAIRKLALTHKHEVNWYSLQNRPPKEQIERLTTIAAEAGLPAKLKDEAARKIMGALSIGTVAASIAELAQFNPPLVGVLFGSGAAAVKYWKDDVPGELGKIKIFRGRLEWPGLIKPVHRKTQR